MDTCWRLVICVVLVALFPLAIVTQYIGPEDTTVVLGGTAILNCSFTALTGGGVTQWSKDGQPIADERGVFVPATYPDYRVIVSLNAPTSQLDLVISEAKVDYEGSYECQVTGQEPYKSADLKVQIDGATPAIRQTSTGSLTEGIQGELTCTATGYRPAVNLQWFRNQDLIGRDTNITETQSAEKADGTTDTTSIWTFTPTRDYNDVDIECRTDTTGRISSSPNGEITLNVRYAPVVTVEYSNKTVVCSADSSPLANNYKIILNKTQIVKEYDTSGRSYNYKPDYCTYIGCNVTNSIGTGVGEVTANPICPDPLPQADALIPIVGAVIGAVLIGILAVGTVVCLRRRRQTKRPRERNTTAPLRKAGQRVNDNILDENTAASPESHRSIELHMTEDTAGVVYETVEDVPTVEYSNIAPDLSFPRDCVEIEGELGRGAFGRVLIGTALGIESSGQRTKIAVKTVKEGADRQARIELREELELMKKVGSHPNVVKLLGYCIEKDPIYVIVEYLGKGDLKKVLMESRDNDTGTGYSNIPGLSKSLSRTLIKFARDVANGMAFVSSQRCVHRDLAARNVLVGDDMVCKVSDFGLARDVMNTHTYHRQSQGPLPMRWMALESLLDDIYMPESDIWSFGIVLWEIVTLGARPYPLMKAKTMITKLQQGYRMPKPKHCDQKLYAMMCSCWRKRPKDRPTFQELHIQLEKMLAENQDYIAVNKLDATIYEVVVVDDSNEKV